MVRYSYTMENLKKAVKTSKSIRECLIKLNIVPAGGNYETFRRLIAANNIDIRHFTGQTWNKGKKFGETYPLEDYLSGKRRMNSTKLRKRLIKENIFERQCSSCKLCEWMNKPITLELSHKDGNNKNNSLSNLELLCPNCHSYTFDWRKAKTSHSVQKFCKICSQKISSNRKMCQDCFKSKEYSFTKQQDLKAREHKFKIRWPEIKELKELVNKFGYREAGRRLGVSDNAIRKHIKHANTSNMDFNSHSSSPGLLSIPDEQASFACVSRRDEWS